MEKTKKDEFIALYNKNIKREGADKLLDWLQNNTDFFTAPASTKYHSCHEGGLCEHSLNVYKHLRREAAGYLADKKTDPKTVCISAESLALVGLLHDVVKVNFYHKSTRNVKNDETGQWEKVPFYTAENSFPFGHGEGSVFLIERFLRLTVTEALAIRWHMGGFDKSAKGGDFEVSDAFAAHPLAVLLHCADLKATYIDEKAK